MPLRTLLTMMTVVLATGCATALERGLEADLAEQQEKLAPARTEDAPVRSGRRPRFDGRLEGYVAYALKNSSALRARFEQWQAATYRIAQQRRLPEPTVTYGLYLSRVETRVGPQRHRFGLSQWFPWPTQLSAGADAASFEAKSAQRRFDAAALAVVRRVSDGYWKLWLIEQTRKVERDQREVLQYAFESARVRLEVGKGGLADVGQIQLSIARRTDNLSGLAEQRRAAAAELVAAMGAPPGTKVEVADADPPLVLPAESEQDLRAALEEHPAIESLELMAESRREKASSAAAEGFPRFMVGVDYIETGEASAPNVPDSGKDAVVLNFGMSIPLWWHVYGAAVDEAEAESAAYRAEQRAAVDDAGAALEQTLSEVRDAVRRVKLYRGTLVPQAETVYGSVLGSYQTGDASLAEVLLAQRDLLELQRDLYGAQAAHARAWARLEELVGREVRARKVTS